jgi:hypothetical protein
MSFEKSRFVCRVAAVLVLVPGLLRADDLLGIFFDPSGRECSGNVPTASFATLHVVFLPGSSTYGGITGAEFSIETPSGGAFLFRDEVTPPDVNIKLGDALRGGTNLTFPSCKSSAAIPLLSFQVYSTGTPAQDVVIRVKAKQQPSNSNFACPLVTLCDDMFTRLCIEGGAALLNPSGQRPCGSSRIDSQWTRVKGLYRP